MNGPLAPLRAWYAGLTRREAWLVGVAGALSAIIALVYGIVLPLGAAHDEAHVRQRAASVAAAQVMAGLATLDGADEVAPQTGPVSQAVAVLAEGEGLVLQSNSAQGPDATVIAVPAASPSGALAFVERLHAAGIVADEVTITPSADGSVSLNATVRRIGS